ncbi:hypothetical protein POM88_012318 [Heracleum sosnowskyi]|uniref:Uncharacterized protein n=1 Tax=Heracleum sosnowskyi TaxID=360622 RepID=A0AAD8IW78_9APIA|nr:hypothetical protein POM88_012318 [Heracleum sosnowskyi]
MCWIFPKSVLAQQLGSGFHGLDIGDVGLDWSSISAYLERLLASPWFATANVARKITPYFMMNSFTSSGRIYHITTIIDNNVHLDSAAYECYGPLYLSTYFAMINGVGFVALSAILACAIAFVFTFPIGIITAITNKAPGLNIITEYIIGYIYPGYQVANMYVKVYGYINMSQEITFLQDFKLGKIPPRTMFLAQVVGTLIASLVYLITAWWLRNYD